MKELCWLSLYISAHFKALLLTFKALNGPESVYLRDHLFLYKPAHPLRQSSDLGLFVSVLRSEVGSY